MAEEAGLASDGESTLKLTSEECLSIANAEEPSLLEVIGRKISPEERCLAEAISLAATIA